VSAAGRKRKRESDSVGLFLDMMATERGASGNTLDAYRRDLEDYADHLEDKKRDIRTGTTDDTRG
jgi:integrase/recombinase XerD